MTAIETSFIAVSSEAVRASIRFVVASSAAVRASIRCSASQICSSAIVRLCLSLCLNASHYPSASSAPSGRLMPASNDDWAKTHGL